MGAKVSKKYKGNVRVEDIPREEEQQQKQSEAGERAEASLLLSLP